jgi:hypothetical protein
MIPSQPKQNRTTLENNKPGSEVVHVDRPHDFGVPPAHTSEVKYASNAALNQDKGRLQTRSNDERDGRRDVGVGVNSGGTGAGSGGDIDTDIVGVGTGGIGISQAPVRKHDELQQHLATGKVAHDRPVADEFKRQQLAEGATSDAVSEIDDQGADAIRTGADNDPFQDATAGEISSDESNGTDNDEGVEVNNDNA